MAENKDSQAAFMEAVGALKNMPRLMAILLQERMYTAFLKIWH